MPISVFAKLPDPPYYAVIFSSLRTGEESGYAEMAEQMMQRAAESPGFLGAESVRGENGFGITVSYWRSEEAIACWKSDAAHLAAQSAGQQYWYEHYELRVSRVERAYGKPEV